MVCGQKEKGEPAEYQKIGHGSCFSEINIWHTHKHKLEWHVYDIRPSVRGHPKHHSAQLWNDGVYDGLYISHTKIYSKNSFLDNLRPFHQCHLGTRLNNHTCANIFSVAICSSVHTVSTAWWQLAHRVLVWCCHSWRIAHLLNGQGATLSEELEYLTH